MTFDVTAFVAYSRLRVGAGAGVSSAIWARKPMRFSSNARS